MGGDEETTRSIDALYCPRVIEVRNQTRVTNLIIDWPGVVSLESFSNPDKEMHDPASREKQIDCSMSRLLVDLDFEQQDPSLCSTTYPADDLLLDHTVRDGRTLLVPRPTRHVNSRTQSTLTTIRNRFPSLQYARNQ